MQTLTHCPVCDSDRIRPRYVGRTTRRRSDAGRWQVYECDRDRHGFINPQPSWEELAPYYSESYPAYGPQHNADGLDDAEAARKAMPTREYRHVAIAEGARLLDVGCGGGFFLKVARRLGADVAGVEPSRVAVETARGAGLDVFHGTPEQYAESRPDKLFDVITAHHVLEHTPDPVRTLAAMRTLLAPGGFVWVAVPNAGCYFSRRLRDRWASTDLPLHLMQFTPESLDLAAARAGFEGRTIATHSVPWMVAGSIRNVLRARWLVPFRVSSRIGPIDSRIAPALARRMDREGRGEAILGTFR